MKHFRTIGVLMMAVAAVLAMPALAQDKKDKKDDGGSSSSGAAVASGGYKIGVVDIEQVIETYPKKKTLMDALASKVTAGQGEIDTMTKRLDGLQSAYEAGKDSFSDADRSAKQLEIRNLITEIKSLREKKQSEIDAEEAKIKSDIFDDVNAAIQQVAEAEGYHLVLNSRSLPNASVLYASKTIDISGKVSAKLGGGSK